MIAAALLLAAGCSGPPVIALTGDHAKLSTGLEALADPGRSLSLRDVAAEPHCSSFTPVHGAASLGATRAGLWLRFRLGLPDDEPGQWRLLVRFSGLDRACVHWPVTSAAAVVTDCAVRAATPAPAGRMANGDLFPVPADYDPTRPVHLYAHSDVWLKLPLEAGTVDGLLRHEHRLQFRWGLYYGVLLAIVLVSFIVYLGRNDRAFFYFSLHIAALALALAVWQGRFAHWDSPGWSTLRLSPALMALFLALGARFYRRFLDTDPHVPWADRLLRLSFWVSLVLAATVLVDGVLSPKLVAANALLWIVASAGAAVVRLRKGVRGAAAVLAAVAVLLAAVLVNALEVIGLKVMDPELALSLLYLGALVGAGFLVLGLASRVHQLARQRDHATELAQASQQLALHRSHFDELTGLPNRAKFLDGVSERLIAAGLAHSRHALVTIGLDRFRAINHALGHEGGDAVLAEIAGRLRAAIPPGDLVARIGPDIFAWLTDIRPAGGSDAGDLLQRCAALRQAVAAPLLQGSGSTLSASLGVALYPEHGAHGEQLLRASDEALYSAKDRGGSIVELFEPALQQHADRYLQLNQELGAALEADRLELHYQPLVALDTGALLGVEALLRWRRGDGRYTPPDQFLPVAEGSDLITPLTDWVFRKACAQMARWRRHATPIPFVGINVSARQFRLPDMVERIARALADAGLEGDALEIELTESALLEDLAATREILSRLRARGIGVAVDDFGVGYSSLNYLRNLPVSTIKIDRSFLRGIPDEPEAISVISAMIALGRDLGLRVLAEGIETLVQREFLQGKGVNYGQGYLFCHPLPAADLETWLRARAPELAAA